MTIYYVMSDGSNDGTRTIGGYASRQTTDFATLGVANYYPTIKSVIDGNTMVDGDEIVCAHTHDYDPAATYAITVANSLLMYCVLSTDLTTESTGAQEGCKTGAGTLYTRLDQADRDVVTVRGITFNSCSKLEIESDINEGSLWKFQNCTLKPGIVTDGPINIWYGSAELQDCTLVVGGLTYFHVYSAAMLIARNLIISGTFRTTSGFIIPADSSTLEISDSDLSSLLGTPALVSGGIALARTSLHKCKMPAGRDIVSYTTAPANKALISSCDVGDGYHYFEQMTFEGFVREDTTNYLAATYDGTNGFSAILEANTFASISAPLRYKLITIPAQDLTATTTYTVNFTSDTTLTDQDFWIELSRPDATDMALGVTQTTRPASILTTGTPHTTNSETWEGGGTNTYEDTISVTGMTGVDNGLVEIWVNLAVPSIDVWVDPAVVIGA